jgi:C1A family cysteine protease
VGTGIAMLNEFPIGQSQPDGRDHVYRRSGSTLRNSVDLRSWDSLIEDQHLLGSCSGNAITNSYELQVKQRYPDQFVELSRLFVYYNARLLEGSETTDAGITTLRSALKSLQQFGVCKEELWPYQRPLVNVRPTDACYQEAKSRTITNYQRLNDNADTLDALNQNLPVVIGMSIYPGFEDLKSNNATISLPDDNTELEGDHAMVLVGYDLDKKLFLAKNSYGIFWGANGYCWITLDYADDNIFERWIFEISDQNLTV